MHLRALNQSGEAMTSPAELPTDRETARLNSIRLLAILFMSNEAEAARDPFERRLKLNELQAAIQAARPELEIIAEGLALS